jgi:hypothetical protein
MPSILRIGRGGANEWQSIASSPGIYIGDIYDDAVLRD